MKIYEVDFQKFLDLLIDIIEAHVFDEQQLHQSFRLEEKESIKRAANIFLQRIFDDYDVVEIKNKYKEKIEENKKNEEFKKSNIIH